MLIYKIINKINSKIYIGKSDKSREEFLKSNYYGSGICIIRAILKYGLKAFKRKIIIECTTSEELNEAERFYIKYYNSIIPKGYNIAIGGQGGPHFKGHKHTKKSKKQMSKSWNYEKMITPSRNKKISRSKKGVPRPQIVSDKLSLHYKGKTFKKRFGVKKAKEIINKIILKNTGKKRTNKFKKLARLRAIGNVYGRSQSQRTREIKRNIFKGDKNPGKNKSKETILKISLAKKGIPSKFKGIPDKKIKCPYCDIIGGIKIMKRWHFKNCRNFKNE